MAAQKKRLGELVLRSANPQELVAFYREVIGLEPYAAIGSATFLKVDDDLEGHPQLLAIFSKSHEFSGPKDMQPEEAKASVGTLHHFAFVLDAKEFSLEQDRLRALDIDVQLSEHSQFGWRSIYLYDPDGNSVELVCYDSAILNAAENERVRQSVAD